MTEYSSGVESSPRFILRLLNSDLCGGEFFLKEGKTFFVVGDYLSNIHQENASAALLDDAIFIPLTDEGINFDVSVSGDNISITMHCESGLLTNCVDLNKRFSIGGLCVAIKENGSEWDDDIFLVQKNVSPGRSMRFIIGGGLLLLASFMIIMNLSGSEQMKKKEKLAQINQVMELFGSNGQEFVVTAGTDGSLYALAPNEQLKRWGMQSLVRNSLEYKTRVLNLRDEEQRVTQWLKGEWNTANAYKLNLENPKLPVLKIATAVLDKSENDSLIALLSEKMPYAENILIKQVGYDHLAQWVENGLKRLSVPYQRSGVQHQVTFKIYGELSDSQILQVKDFISEYQQAWGSKFVGFSVELQDNWIKGKSLKYGGNDYIKISPGHWDFSI